jgi:hypothetical protein
MLSWLDAVERWAVIVEVWEPCPRNPTMERDRQTDRQTDEPEEQDGNPYEQHCELGRMGAVRW